MLVYRVAPMNGGVVFAELHLAERNAQIHRAISSSNTWGQFKKAMPPDEYKSILGSLAKGEDPLPKARDPFQPEAIPGFCEGDYPRWLQPAMDNVLPDDVLRRFGKRESTMLNGSYWHIPEANIPGITAALEQLGWEVVHAPDLPFS